MNHHEPEQEFLDKIKVRLDAGIEQMDPAISARLGECRRLALAEQVDRPPGWFQLPRLVPLAGFATLAVAVVAGSLWFSLRAPPATNQVAEEIEILTIGGKLEMYENLEFYQWLAKTNEKG